MRKSIISLLSVFFVCSVLMAENANVIYPSDWKLNEKPGQIFESGSETILQVKGDGTTSNYWLSSSCGLEGGHTYMISFWGRSPDKGKGTFITGPSGCNIDRYSTFNPNWELCRDIIVFPHGKNDSPIRMGQWMLNGTAEYKKISLVEVFPIYARQGEFILGNGETLKGNEYAFSASYNSWGHAEARVLDYLSTDFNTDRLVFGKDQQVVYHFTVGDRMFLNAKLETSIHYYAGGILIVEASNDKENWTALGTLDHVGDLRLDLPTGLLPAKHIYVRLRITSEIESDANNADPGSLQIKVLNFNAAIDGAPISMNGTTQYAEILKPDEKVSVDILDLGSAIPDGDNAIRLKVTNLSGRQLNLEPNAVLSNDARTFSCEQTLQVSLAPNESKELRVPYNLMDTGTWMLNLSLGGESSFQSRCELIISDYFNNSYGELLTASQQAVLWSAPAEWKVNQTRKVPSIPGKALEISCARGESEAVQLVITPKEELQGVNFQVSALKNADGALISERQIDLLRVHYLDIQIKTDATSILGYWPDPLPPVKPDMTLKAKLNQPFFVRANIPMDAKAGTYEGTIKITAQNGWSSTVPLRLRVFDFTLPETMTCETAFGFSIWEPEIYHKTETEEQKAKLFDDYLDFLSKHHISPYDPVQKYGIEPRLVGKDEGKPLNEWEVAIDWTKWDERVAAALGKYHFNTIKIPVTGLGTGTFYDRIEPEFLGYAEETPEYQTLYPKYLRAIQDHLEEKGWLDKAYVYWFDEPFPKDYDFVMNGFRKLREGAPKLRRMLTESIEEPLLGGPNLWCPHSYGVNEETWAKRRAIGEQLWWYVCTGPKEPYVTLFIDHPGIEMRTWLWQSWKYKVQGVLIWHTNYWTSPTAYPDGLQNPYTDPMSWMTGYGTEPGTKQPWGNGDGRFFYPPEDAQDGSQDNCILEPPVSSIRMEMLRDGIEDYEYFAMLKKLLEEKKVELTDKEIKEYSKLLDVPPEVTSSMTKFSVDPTPLKIHRDKLGEAIEILMKK